MRMDMKKFIGKEAELKLMFYFTAAYLLIFSIAAYLNQNYEFFLYVVILCILLLIVIKYHKQMHLSVPVMLGLTIFGLLHMFGGNLILDGVRLYDAWLFSYLRYDQLVHMFGTFLLTFVAYNMLYPHLDKRIEHSVVLLSMLLIFIVAGFGVFNELLELIAVIILKAAEGVGSYINNALDLFYNFLGALLACIVIMKYHKKKHGYK